MKPQFAAIAVVALIVLVTSAQSFTVIEGGHRGVAVTLGSIHKQALGEGVHFITPFMTKVNVMSIRIQKTDVKAMAGTRDLQHVGMEVVVNYQLDPGRVVDIYREVGDEEAVIARIVSPANQEGVKAAVAKMNAEELLTKREELSRSVLEDLRVKLAKRGIIVSDVSIANIDFSDEFDRAVEAKQIAQQQAQQARFLAERATNEAAAAIEVARGQAEAQRLLRESLTSELLTKLAIEKWDGKLPTVTGSGGTPLLNLSALKVGN